MSISLAAFKTCTIFSEFPEVDIANKISKADDVEKITLKAQLLNSGNLLGILNDSPDNWLGYGKANEDIDEDIIDQLIKSILINQSTLINQSIN